MSGSAEREAEVRLAAVLSAAGWNLRGVLPAERYDPIVAGPWRCDTVLPEARSVLVLGSGGRALWTAFRAAPEFGQGDHPLDAFCTRVAGEAAAALDPEPGATGVVLAHEARRGRFADLVALGREAGLGAPSRLGLLVHPVYGPWLSIRAALLTRRALPPTPRLADFDPCPGCPAPCAVACHGDAVAPGGFRVDRCGSTRAREPACAARCDARRACVLGPAHAYAPEAEAHHMRWAGIRPPG